MNLLKALGAVLVVSASAAPAFAADAMMSNGMSMMKGGEVMAVMPDGHMGSMMASDPAMMAEMMKMATPLASCIILITDKNGKVYMVQPKTKDEIAECQKMAM